MSVWPKIETIQAFFSGRAALVGTEEGIHYRIVQSGLPHVRLVQVGQRPVILCSVCDTKETMPASPTSMGLNGAPEPLFVPGRRAHALFALTWMNKFAGDHEHKEVDDGKEESVRLQGR